MAQNTKTTREDRLKAALKANMGRRKVQKRIRAEEPPKPRPDEQEKPNG
ncbi:hypothetical protein SAMN05444004_1333 [Jannaschia faecimaris]|uniref:Uncharacterized protein n=1 Tax=Jannaschia faecimaris TaxID=1244108 RepID=A0A1H3UFQ3_9RHOB|nr:hypothetical protein [Jannaschia faecimaris]SDZ61107.1 hypothetical protein SAMN05444004_1333 [Jannaschia faecimaris]